MSPQAKSEKNLPEKVKAIVIGGGVVGVGALYHLAKKGWTDSILLEKNDLTSGSTWHAAGLLPLFNVSYSVSKIHDYSVKLYDELQQETGMNTGLKIVSNIRLARTQDRVDEYKYYIGVAKTVGVDVRWLSPEQVKEEWPLCNTQGLLGAIQHQGDGYVQPADLTQALAKGARTRGATIFEHTSVLAIERENEEWLVTTNKGLVRCEHVISCSGNYARKTGEMVGLDIPVMPVEHQFIVTEPHPEILKRKQQGLPEMGVLRESDSGWYMREEAGGLLLGPYEKGAPVCYVNGPEEGSKYELFNADLERLEPHIEAAFVRVPAFGEVGVKEVYNGAIAYTPDGNPIIGPAPGLKNFWLSEGHSFGITAAGGAGWQLAEWIVDGEPTIDMSGVDPRRYGPYASYGYLKEKNEEAYHHVFKTHYPDEEREAARPLKRSPCYDKMKSLGAVFGSVYGWDRPNWFKPNLDYKLPDDLKMQEDVWTNKNYAVDSDGNIVEQWSFRRANYFEHVGNECRHVMKHVGLLDMTPFSKYIVSGKGVESWLNTLVANKVPAKKGRIALTHMLSKNGGVRAEYTVYRTGKNSFYLVSAGALENHDWDYLIKHRPNDGSVDLQKVTTQNGVLVLAGPKSRQVLQKLTDTDLSNANFPWLSGQTISVGAAKCEAIRVNFIGELGWELHHPIEMQGYIFEKLFEEGAEFNIKPFGIRAMDSMRIEKSYRLMARELSIEYSAYESGLDFFIKMNKEEEFIGKQSLLNWQEKGFNNAFVTVEIHGIKDVDARGQEPLYYGGELVGRATSGGYGFRLEKSLALGMIKPELAKIGTEIEITILGENYKATIIEESPYDPKNEKLRS